MFPRLGVLCLSGLLSVGCISKKTDEVAVEEVAPPAAAYPDSPSNYGDSASGVAATTAQNSSAPAPATAAPQPPAFQLRPGEQLVPHQIQSGENLSVIAAKYNASIGRIKAANGMSGTKIYAGKTIQVPTSAPPNLAMSSGASNAPSGDVYGSTGGRYGPVTSTAPGTSAPATAAPGVYPSVTAPPAPPRAPSYPASTSTAPPIQVPSAPASTSYPSVSAPTVPVAPPPTPPTPPTPQPFPTPSFGNGNIQFSQ